MMILDTKIIPSHMSSWIGIDSKEKIKLIGLYFDGAIKISWLEGTIKYILFCFGQTRIHTFKSPIKYLFTVVNFIYFFLFQIINTLNTLQLMIFFISTLYLPSSAIYNDSPNSYYRSYIGYKCQFLAFLPYFLWSWSMLRGLGPK